MDSKSAKDLAENPVYYNRSKHIEIKYHWIREHVDPEGDLQTAILLYVRTGDQSADMHTKSLTGLPFVEHREHNLGTKRSSTEVAEEATQVSQITYIRSLSGSVEICIMQLTNCAVMRMRKICCCK